MKYTPQEGFYDLSMKPETLSTTDHETVQANQMWLMRLRDMKYTYTDKQWELAKEISAKLQLIILEHYKPHEPKIGEQITLF